jgi:hypothetical protein
MALNIQSLILSLVFIVIAVALISPIQTSVENSNVTGTSAVIVSLIPLIFAVGILVGVVRGMIGGK